MSRERFEARFEFFEVLEVFVGFFVLGFDAGTEIVEAGGEDGDVTGRVGVFADGFFPECVVSGVGWTSVEAYLVRIYEVVEVVLESALGRSRVPRVINSLDFLL